MSIDTKPLLVNKHENRALVHLFYWSIDLHMLSQPLFHTELETNLSLAFEIESNIMICSLKPLSVQQFEKKFHLAVQNKLIIYLEHLSLTDRQSQPWI